MALLSPAKIHACFVCKQPADQRCSTCGNARYCSVACQKKDWKMHKIVCKSFAALEPRPGPAFFRCILFAPDEPLPRFVWAEYGSTTDYTTMNYKAFTGNHFLGHIDSEEAVPGCNAGDAPLQQPDSHRLGIYYQDAYLIDGSPITPSIAKWVGREAGHYFRGTFLAHGWRPEGMEKDDVSEFGKPCDLDTADLRYLLRYFQVQGERHRKIHGDFKEFK